MQVAIRSVKTRNPPSVPSGRRNRQRQRAAGEVVPGQSQLPVRVHHMLYLSLV